MVPRNGDRADAPLVGEGHPRSARIRRRGEFRAIQSGGQKVHTRHFLIVLSSRQDDAQRLGVTVTKKVGSAVGRNRVKRLVKEVFRKNRGLFPHGCDVVFIAKSGAPDLDYATVLDEVTRARGAMEGAARRARSKGSAA